MARTYHGRISTHRPRLKWGFDGLYQSPRRSRRTRHTVDAIAVGTRGPAPTLCVVNLEHGAPPRKYARPAHSDRQVPGLPQAQTAVVDLCGCLSGGRPPKKRVPSRPVSALGKKDALSPV